MPNNPTIEVIRDSGSIVEVIRDSSSIEVIEKSGATGPAGPQGPPGPSPERGHVESTADLDAIEPESGYIYYVQDTGHVWTWHDDDDPPYWEDLGSFRGDPGPPGPPGPSGGDVFVFTQLAPEDRWSIVHDLGRYPSVSVVDSGDTVIFADVSYDSVNSLTVSFGSPTSGKAYLN